MEQKTLYDQAVYQQIRNRIDQLTSETKPQWGKMGAAQMLAHCSEILEVANGKPLKNTPLLARVFKGMIRKMVVSEKPYPKSTQTHPQYKQKDPKNFENEKLRLLAALERFKEMEGEEAKKVIHPLFGTMSPEEKGWSSYKHLDHHLTQFGV